MQFNKKKMIGFGAGLTFLLYRFGSSQTPASNPPVFTHPTEITNPYLPLGSLKQDILEGKENGTAVRVERTRLKDTKTFLVDGKEVQTLVMQDQAFAAGKLEEIALDYFAQADDGTVYYFGEQVDNYKNGKLANHTGTWLYGVHTKTLGVFVPAKPEVGNRFLSEDAPGISQINNQVISTFQTVTVPAGTFKNCLKIKQLLSDGTIEYKFFAPNVGIVRELPGDGQTDLKAHNN